MRRLLSTKALSKPEILRLESAGWRVDQYDAITVELLRTTVAPGTHLVVFTSKNAVKAFLESFSQQNFSGIRGLCVGRRASEMLKKAGITVLEETQTSQQLALCIEERYSKESFVYYCGDRRLNRIPRMLNGLGVQWEEAVVYKTLLNYRKFKREYEAALFFSPSGVESFTYANEMRNTTGYCIGATTAAALKKYTDCILIAKTPDIPGLIELAETPINLLKQ